MGRQHSPLIALKQAQLLTPQPCYMGLLFFALVCKSALNRLAFDKGNSFESMGFTDVQQWCIQCTGVIHSVWLSRKQNSGSRFVFVPIPTNSREFFTCRVPRGEVFFKKFEFFYWIKMLGTLRFRLNDALPTESRETVKLSSFELLWAVSSNIQIVNFL